MATFNFRVRATDDMGAFADRDFSINVRNTQVEQFVATLGNSGHIITSVDGKNWTLRQGFGTTGTQTATASALGSVAYGNGKWLIIASNTQYRYSTDAINWTTVDIPVKDPVTFTNKMPPIIFANGKFWLFTNYVNSGDTVYRVAAATSVDGVNWTYGDFMPSNTAVVGTSLGWSTPATAGDTIIVPYASTGTNTGAAFAYISTDGGNTWTHTNLVQRRERFAYHNGLWFNWSETHTTQLFYWTSIDGINWIQRSLPARDTNEVVTSIVYGNGQLVMLGGRIGSTATAAATRLWTSTNGIDWTARNYGTLFSNASNSSIQSARAVYYNGLFVYGSTLAFTSGGFRYSEDGINWTADIQPVSSIPTAQNVIYGIAAISLS